MTPSCEVKLATLAAQNAALVSALTWPNVQGNELFQWFDRQVVQGDLGKPSNGRACVTVQRVSTAPSGPTSGNQGGPIQPLSAVRLQINCVAYNAEQTRQVAAAVKAFLGTVSLCAAGEFASPQTAPSQNPNFLLNERGGMLPLLQPPAYVETLDVRVWNRDDIPS